MCVCYIKIVSECFQRFKKRLNCDANEIFCRKDCKHNNYETEFNSVYYGVEKKLKMAVRQEYEISFVIV